MLSWLLWAIFAAIVAYLETLSVHTLLVIAVAGLILILALQLWTHVTVEESSKITARRSFSELEEYDPQLINNRIRKLYYLLEGGLEYLKKKHPDIGYSIEVRRDRLMDEQQEAQEREDAAQMEREDRDRDYQRSRKWPHRIVAKLWGVNLAIAAPKIAFALGARPLVYNPLWFVAKPVYPLRAWVILSDIYARYYSDVVKRCWLELTPRWRKKLRIARHTEPEQKFAGVQQDWIEVSIDQTPEGIAREIENLLLPQQLHRTALEEAESKAKAEGGAEDSEESEY